MIRNLTEADIEDGVLKEHGDPKKHGAQDEDDPKRKNKEKK